MLLQQQCAEQDMHTAPIIRVHAALLNAAATCSCALLAHTICCTNKLDALQGAPPHRRRPWPLCAAAPARRSLLPLLLPLLLMNHPGAEFDSSDGLVDKEPAGNRQDGVLAARQAAAVAAGGGGAGCPGLLA